ncbi:M20 family metallopeptidase [Brevibacillus ruminantium]|uniref:M20 family metallopeptidase n=1 Tax=Brevibacillus ruminantium TaxID=2950604 RepID=A0ABY4WLH7_9BACL|nr:M20 family metallopeptidase [Brevibacillus ruminantium]USG66917.1 M20 family metallopeptidase [Brevibacillus ruminantium]
MSSVLSYLKEAEQQILSDLERVVRAESPTHDKAAVDHCGDVFQELFHRYLGLSADVIPMKETGNQLRYTIGDGPEQILITGHIDTVWEKGRLSFRTEGNRAYGPGILDMKGGNIQALWALRALREVGLPLNKKIVFLLTSDEETGSDTSRALIEEEARKSVAVLVPEPAVAHTGALKTARKGVGHYQLAIKGKAAHAGNHHEDGISAIQEMALQIIDLHALTDYAKGTTVNVGIASGGNRTNVVAEHALLDIDVRITSMAEAERIQKAVLGAVPKLDGITLKASGALNRPPMERTAETARLFELASQCGEQLGFTLTEAAAGGGSDGNFTAALGIPTLDGLGSVGDGPHAEYEHILIDQLAPRSALLAHLLAKL